MSKYEGHTEGDWRVELTQLHLSTEKTGYTIVTDAYDVVSGHLAIRKEADAILAADAPKLLAQRDRLRVALEALYDVQNGPPLLTWAAEWQRAMFKAEDVLKESTDD